MSSSAFFLILVFTEVVGAVVKRSDDTSLLEDVVSRLSAELQSLRSEVTVFRREIDLLNTKVGFMTSVPEQFIQNSAGEIVKLSAVQYNEGQGYDPLTGIFTAPVAGLYSFFLKTESSPGHGTALRVIHEGHSLLYLYGSDPTTYLTPSGDVVVHLAKGDRVWVQGSMPENLIRIWTRFGGFLIHPDSAQ